MKNSSRLSGVFETVFIALILSNCATHPDVIFYGNVERYGDTKTTYEFKYDEKILKNLQLKSFADVLANKLFRLGWSYNDNAKYSFFLSVDVKPIKNEASIPQIGIAGYSDSSTQGVYSSSGSSGTYSSTTQFNPIYGITGYRSYSYYTYMRTFTINMFDTQSKKPVLTVIVTSKGREEKISKMIEPLAHMLYLNMSNALSSGTVVVSCFNAEKSIKDIKNMELYRDKVFEPVIYAGKTFHCAEI